MRKYNYGKRGGNTFERDWLMAQPEYSPDEHCNDPAWFSNNWILKTSGLETWLGEKPQEKDYENPQRSVVLLFEVLAEEQLLIISKQVVERDLMNNFDNKNTISSIHFLFTTLPLLHCFHCWYYSNCMLYTAETVACMPIYIVRED